MICSRAIRCAVGLLLIVWLRAGWPVSAPVEQGLDDVYRALGQGDMARADKLSADLFARIPDRDDRRGAVLQARLDVLYTRSELVKPDGQVLRDAVQKYTARDPRGHELQTRLAIAEALARNDAQTTWNLAQAALIGVPAPAGIDAAELNSWQARAAALSNGQQEQARAQAQIAFDFWHAQRGLRARWHEVETDYIIGNIYFHTGSAAKALAQFDLGAQLAIAGFGADSLARIKMDTTRAGVLVDLGRNSDALAVREAVLVATRHRYGDHSIEAAKSEAMIGASLQEIGDYPSARQRYAHVEALLATLANAPSHERGLIATNFGNLLQEMGEADAARAHYRQALAAFGDDEQTTHVRAVVYANMGNTEFRLKHFDVAITDFQRALGLREKSDGKDSPGLGYALEGLGSATLALKRYPEAERHYRRALELRGRALAPNHPSIAPLNFGLALARWGQGDAKGAFRLAVQTAEHQQTMLAVFAADFSERQSVAYRNLLVPATALAVTLAASRGDADSIATAWRLAMVERGLVARTETQRLAAARAAHDPALAPAWAAWRSANAALGDAWLSTSTDAAHLEQLRAAAEQAERTVWDRTGNRAGYHGDAPSVRPTAIADLSRALPADGLLLAFTEGVTGDPARLLKAGGEQTPEDWYGFALGADGNPRLHRIGRIEALSAQVHAWYAGLRDPGSDPARLRRNGLALKQQLLDPFITGDSARRLFIVPEGELFRVSFAALPNASQGYLIDSGTRVHTLVNETDLVLPSPRVTAATALLAGAPDFPGVASADFVASRQLCLRAARQGFAAIPNAARELHGLQTLLSASSTKPQIQIVSGSAATKENVLAALPHVNIAHLATHGFSLDESCADDGNRRGVSLNQADAADTTNTSTTAAVSGLAFTGANVSAGHSPVGVLSAGELGTLDLSHLEWIALSACDSGLGPIGRNEGVFGMRRALRLAGARTVVMSLWQVDDAATADLMQSLYRNRFVEHADVPDAMANAMRSVIAVRRAAGQSDHPYYWAAFVSEGGWR